MSDSIRMENAGGSKMGDDPDFLIGALLVKRNFVFENVPSK